MVMCVFVHSDLLITSDLPTDPSKKKIHPQTTLSSVSTHRNDRVVHSLHAACEKNPLIRLT